jgi:hypothetical protein
VRGPRDKTSSRGLCRLVVLRRASYLAIMSSKFDPAATNEPVMYPGPNALSKRPVSGAPLFCRSVAFVDKSRRAQSIFHAVRPLRLEFVSRRFFCRAFLIFERDFVAAKRTLASSCAAATRF